MLNREDFIILLDKYTAGSITPEEHSQLLNSINSGLYNDLILAHIENNLQNRDTDKTGADLPPHRSADILYKILSSEKQTAALIPGKQRRMTAIRWSVAAAVVAAIIFGAVFFSRSKMEAPAADIVFTKDMKEQTNGSGQPLKIEMEEGSIITLQPGAAIHYPIHFSKDKREVFLEGEAFFEVSKNAARPFFVYNKNVVTHVLGTSFNVKINDKTHQVEVSVRTGRVEVYENKRVQKSATEVRNNGVVLLPNQKVTYDQATRQFVPSIVDVPLPVINESGNKKEVLESFVFEEASLRKVLQSLEKTYGIEIVVENENIYNCLFTGDVSQQELYSRLDIICQSVQAAYEIKGTKILIKGAGCK